MVQAITLSIIAILFVVLIVAGTFYYLRQSNKIKKGKYGKEVTVGFIIVAGATAFGIPALSLLTVESENVTSVNNFVNWKNGTLDVTIKYTNPLEIPLRYTMQNLSNLLYVDVTGLKNLTFNSPQLISPENSIISYDGEFRRLNQSSNSIEYVTELNARHYDDISNKSYPYELRISYVDNENNTLHSAVIPFQWTIIPKDLNWLGYFWIVLAGIVASRFITFVVDTPQLERLDINRTEAVWLVYSFIIAVLAFAGFKDQNILGASIFFNIMAAFAFGFGSQKVLELARQFPRSQNEASPPAQITDLTAVVAAGQINLGWTESKETDLHHYNIYRGTETNFEVIPSSPYSMSQINQFEDDNVPPNTYYYRVAAVNLSNKIGKLSVEASETVQ